MGSSEGSSESEEETSAAPPIKRPKFQTSTPAPTKTVPTPSPEESATESVERDSGIEEDKKKFASDSKKKTNSPYLRIQNYGEIVVNPKMADNSFESKAGFDTWG